MKNSNIEKILNSISPERKKELDDQIEAHIKESQRLIDEGYVWNTDKSYSLKIIREHGYNPIGITTIICEETFVFKTQREAKQAYKELEVEKNLVDGWWYGEKDFNKKIVDSEHDAPIYWLNK